MGTYNLPRNVKGEGRILFIFTPKSLIYASVGAGVGLIFYLILISIVLCLISGLVPAKIASKKDPVISLRSE